MTKLWRINISPASGPGVDARVFCFERGVVGFGWRVDSRSKALTWEEYEELATKSYYEADDKGWWPAANALYNRMSVGDLVWSRDWHGTYFLGRITGEWQYDNTGEHSRADIVNYRPCAWYRIGLAHNVPGAVCNSFSRGRVLQAVDSQAALAYSAKLYADMSGNSDLGLMEITQGDDIFGLMSASGVEDLVGLFVQSLGYSLVPSTCKQTTAFYEFVLKHRKTARTAVVQVKAGSEPLDRDAYGELADEVFLFSASESYIGGEYANVRCLSRNTLETFAREQKDFLPEPIRMWL